MPPFIQTLYSPFFKNLMKQKRHRIFQSWKPKTSKDIWYSWFWILWLQRNLFTNENDPEWNRFPQTLHSSFEFTANILFKWWLWGVVRGLSSLNVYLDCKESWGLSHQNCQRYGDVSSLGEVAVKGHHWRCEENNHGEDIFHYTCFLNRGINGEGPEFCPLCLIACCQVETSWIPVWSL